ncbi:MAG: type II secretion system protein [Phycisphaerales bacterium]
MELQSLPSEHRKNRSWRPGARAFTITEMLVVIAVVALLIALVVPALSRARSAARGTSCQSNLKQVATSVQTYLQSFQETYPFATAGSPFFASPPEESSNKAFVSSSSHWELSRLWMSPLGSVSPWRSNFSVWICPGAQRRSGEPWVTETGERPISSYRFLSGFFARPEVWHDGALPNNDLLKCVRVADVLSPSGKAMFVDAEMAHNVGGRPSTAGTPEGPPTPILFADSHVRMLRPTEARKPGRNPFTGTSLPLYDTVNGVRGVDF